MPYEVLHEKVIDEPNAPARLVGKVIKVMIDEVTDKMTFKVEVPDDITAQEKGYLDWFIGEFVDRLKEEVPGMIGDKTSAVVPD